MEKNSYPAKAILRFSNFGYLVGCTILFGIAFWIMGAAVYSIWKDAIAEAFTIYKLLDEVGLVIFAVAVIDVAKHLLMEEVVQRKDEEEGRKSLSKLAAIIATALCLEGFVLTIEAAKFDITRIYFPVSVLLTAILLIVAIGVHVRLTSKK